MKKRKPTIRRNQPQDKNLGNRIRPIESLVEKEPDDKKAEEEPSKDRLLVKIKEAAYLLSISERKVRDLVAKGVLEARGSNRLRRITMTSINRYAGR
jgi:excisionase family DNA binding protein